MFKKHVIKVLAIVVLFSVFYKCSGEEEKTDPIVNDKFVAPAAQITAPLNQSKFTIGEPITIEIKVNRPEAVSNLALYVNDTVYTEDLNSESQTVTIQTNDKTKVGLTGLYLSYEDENGKVRKDNRKVILFSDLIPTQKTVTIVNTFEHAKTSYTQGLEFYQGKLFEGTGQKGQSILAEVELTTGKKLREHNLENHIFGEGITILNDTIYQITYLTQKCFVYDMNFNEINSFSYAGQGWGLCNDGEYLIMSNGSSEIVWRDRKTFEIVKSIYVFDNQAEIININELELIDGNLFANIYTKNNIIEVDMATGKVLTSIDCELLKQDANSPGMDVLNGIAHNPLTGKTYMTGKWWPKLYEVTFE